MASLGFVGLGVMGSRMVKRLLVAGQRYYTATGPLPTTRETQSNLNNPAAGEG